MLTNADACYGGRHRGWTSLEDDETFIDEVIGWSLAAVGVWFQVILLCPAYVSIRQHASAYVSIRQHTSAYVSIRQHTSAILLCPCVCISLCV
jgi:hypothetical protein